MTALEAMAAEVRRFWVEVIGGEVPDEPRPLEGSRFIHAAEHLQEELDEFQDAEDLESQADALIDLVYVALGRLIEMGLAPGPAFDAVHQANMAKAPGIVEGREHSEGLDATKPEGWSPPNLAALLHPMSPLFAEASRIRAERGAEYNRGGVELEDYFPFGDASYAHMIHLKSLRLVSLVGSGKTEPEQVRDTIVDLANYLAFYYEAKKLR